MEQDDGARAELDPDPPADLLAPRAVGVPHAKRPPHDPVPEPPRRQGHERIAVAVGGAEQARGPPHGLRDRGVGLPELAADACRTAQVQLDVVLRVVAHLVPCGRDPAGEVGMPLDVVADEEERRRHPRRGERLEDARCGGGVRAVVECQIERPGPPGAAADHAAEHAAVGMVQPERQGAGRRGSESRGEQRRDHRSTRS